ncbi:MAG TPA: hypothetical protein DDW81_07215, partial [Cryomorphaceae bacterium]|nr:hypothetical protein [Cryomorphaceae bacterium]
MVHLNVRKSLATALCILQYGTWAQTWQRLTDFPGFHRDDGVSFIIDNTAFCGTGLTPWFAPLADFEAFDLSTESWSSIAPIPAGNERQYASAFSLNGKGYVFGGIGNKPFNDLWQYDPQTDIWQQMKHLPDSGRSGSTSFVLNGYAYICGGRSSSSIALAEIWVYDPLSNDWSQKTNLTFGARWRACSATINNTAYLLFGQDENHHFHNELYSYEPSSDTWSIAGYFPGPGRTHAAMQAINGHLVVFGGRDSLNNYDDTLWSFNPTDGSWKALNNSPFHGRKGGMTFTNGTDFYYTTGIDSSNTRLQESWKCSSPVIGIEKFTTPSFKLYSNPAT